MSTLIPYNLNNSKLKDDNFELKISNNENIENYQNNSDIYENYENNEEKDQLIEKFSNHNSSCALVSGDEIIVEHGSNDDEHLIDINTKKFAPKKKYLTKFIINKGEKGTIIKYGDSICLTKSGKKNETKQKFKEIGPYADTGNRALRYGPKNYGYTAEACAEATKGFKYFALQHGDATTGWCSADNDLNHAKKYGKSNKCDRGPSGIRGGGKSGGPWCNYIYEKIIDENNWKKPSISCDTDRIYINAKADSNYSVTNKNESECQKTCGKQDKCDMYLMSSDNTCHLYNNVSNVTEYCSPDSPGPPHRYWGKVKSNCSEKFKILTDSDNKKGDIVFYNNKLNLSGLGNIIFNRAPGKMCSIKYPTNVTGMDGDYSIKEIKVRCDDFFEMYIDGVTYKGSGWNRTFTFRNPKIRNPKGYIIGFKCTNGGGPGGLIVQIEFQNGSLMVSDNTWLGCKKINNENLFKTNPTNYYHEKDSWKGVNVIGLNQNNKLKWDGRIIPSWDRAFVDSNFSQFANYIWGGKCLDRGSVYIKKRIGIMPWGESCSNNMTTAQAICYLERYPSLKQKAIDEVSTKYRYEFISSRMNWGAHVRNARRKGGNLVCIHNKKTNDFLMRKYLHRTHSGDGFFIGAYRISNMSTDRGSRTWRWVDGSPWTYKNFRRHYEPNNYRERVLHMWKYPPGSWNDHSHIWLRLPAVYQYKISDGIINWRKLTDWAKRHWKNVGCRTNLTFSCVKPPQTIGMYNYEGCYYEDYKRENVPNYRGKVNSLNECKEKAVQNRDVVFGVTNFGECYTGNNINKVRKESLSEYCPQLGKDGSMQVYNRRKPFDPLQAELSRSNFSEKFSNISDEVEQSKLSANNFSEKFKNNKRMLSIIFILIIICLILYLCFTK